jgi:hypothetical protein
MMTHYEQMMAVYRRNNTGSIPWAAYGTFLLPSGANERELRNSGCGWIHWTPVCSWIAPGMSHMAGWMFEGEIKDATASIKLKWENGRRIIRRQYDTPKGSVYEELHEELGYHSLYVKKFLIEKPEDYEVVKYMVENTVLRPNYEGWCDAHGNLGTDGVELAVIDRSPFQKTLLELCGTERLYFDLHEIPEVVEDLLQVLARKELEAFAIVADSPAEVVWMVENITGSITAPRMYQKYCLPFYNQVAKLLHDKNKVLAMHLDGLMGPLKDLIAQTDVDVVESFTLPEMGGNVSIKDACNAWPDKAIVANIPAHFCRLEKKAIWQFLEEFFTQLPTKNFMFELSENFPLKELRRVLPIFSDFMNNQ